MIIINIFHFNWLICIELNCKNAVWRVSIVGWVEKAKITAGEGSAKVHWRRDNEAQAVAWCGRSLSDGEDKTCWERYRIRGVRIYEGYGKAMKSLTRLPHRSVGQLQEAIGVDLGWAERQENSSEKALGLETWFRVDLRHTKLDILGRLLIELLIWK